MPHFDLPFPGFAAPSPPDRMPDTIVRFVADWKALERRHPNRGSADRHQALSGFLASWLRGLQEAPDFETDDDRIDALLLELHIDEQSRLLVVDHARRLRIADALPGIASLRDLEDARGRWERADAESVASSLDRCSRELPGAAERLSASATPSDRLRAAEHLREARAQLERWWEFYGEYDPMVGWWCRRPVEDLKKTFQSAAEHLDQDSGDGLTGDPIGDEALRAGLRRHGIDATPEELIAAASRELQWCREEGEKAVAELGLASWAEALEAGKRTAVAPGEQPWMVADLALEAVRWVTERDLVEVDPVALHTWRMTMMSEEAQRSNPFFLGGECIWVSYPTSTMDHERKRMSARGNNPEFSRATVQHELIPGHHLQQYSEARYRPYRRLFATPFWIEGWTLHWEMLLWDRGFPRTPGERIGMLYWRMHRCARVVFSLEFHRGERSGQSCVDFLVETCGHERDNAEAEVRRSLSDAYDPLYQLAYLIGGLQVRALHRECTRAGLSDRQFHDRFLRINQMPIKAMRCLWNGRTSRADWETPWKFLPETGPPHTG